MQRCLVAGSGRQSRFSHNPSTCISASTHLCGHDPSFSSPASVIHRRRVHPVRLPTPTLCLQPARARASLDVADTPQPSQKTFRIKQKLAKASRQNRPIPQWFRLKTDNKIQVGLALSTAERQSDPSRCLFVLVPLSSVSLTPFCHAVEHPRLGDWLLVLAFILYTLPFHIPTRCLLAVDIAPDVWTCGHVRGRRLPFSVERQEATLAPHEAQPLIDPIRDPIPALISLSRPLVLAGTQHNNLLFPDRMFSFSTALSTLA